MAKYEDKRQQIIDKACEYLLAHGLASFTLRALGAAVGISDRMLLHYFKDKHDLLSKTLQLVVEQLFTQLRALNPVQMGKSELMPLS